MKDAVHWLNFLSAIFGFLSVVVLAAATVGPKQFSHVLAWMKVIHSKAGAANAQQPVPPIIIPTGSAMLTFVAILWWLKPPDLRSMSFGGIGVLFLVVVIGGWILAFIVMFLMEVAIGFGNQLRSLERRRIAGWIGFGLLLVSFVLILMSTGIEVAYIEPTTQTQSVSH